MNVSKQENPNVQSTCFAQFFCFFFVYNQIADTIYGILIYKAKHKDIVYKTWED